jgi:hypothetical protein
LDPLMPFYGQITGAGIGREGSRLVERVDTGVYDAQVAP